MARPRKDEITKTLQDVAYVSVGLGVMAFQRAQVRRQELQKQLGRIGAAAEERVQVVEERLDAAEERVDAVLSSIEGRLPDQVASFARQARSAARQGGERPARGSDDPS
jgi:hypothetical protein